MLNSKDLLELANLYIDIDPNLSAIILTLANCRMADKLLPSPIMEEWCMGICVAMTKEALHQVNYNTWLQSGGTENEGKVEGIF